MISASTRPQKLRSVFVLALFAVSLAEARAQYSYTIPQSASVNGGTLSWTKTYGAKACGFPGGHSTYLFDQWYSFAYSMGSVTYPLTASGQTFQSYVQGLPYGGSCPKADSTTPSHLTFTYQPPNNLCTITFNSGSASGSCAQTYSGYVNPKYVVVGVTYAPPGPSSFVQYTSGTTLATNKSTSQSFSNGKTISVSVSNGTGIKGWASGHVTISNSNSVTQASSSSTSVTLTLATQLATKTAGTPSAFSPIAHDYDIIWLWLNPVTLYTVIPTEPNVILWNGYGYDTTDQPAMDIWPMYVGYLNGHFGALPAEDVTVLARSWAAKETWPAGQGPGLTQGDFNQILQADPFSNSSYSVVLSTTASPATTTDGRFTISGGANGTAQSFDYVQALPGQPPINQTFQNTYSTMSTLGQSTTTTTQEMFGIDVSFTSTIFIDNLSEDIKYSQTLIWTDMSSTSTSTTTTQIDSLSITGPPCNTSTLPCVPAYTGPPEFDVYQDNIYGTFMFNPVN